MYLCVSGHPSGCMSLIEKVFCDREWHTPVGLVVHGRVGGGRVGAGGVPAAEAAAGALAAAAAAAKRPLLGLCAKVFAEHEIHGGGFVFHTLIVRLTTHTHARTHARTHGGDEERRRGGRPGLVSGRALTTKAQG
jgi:hypothetical protein